MNGFFRRSLYPFVASALAVCLVAPQLYGSGSEEDAVLAPIHALFDGMAKRDGNAIRAAALPTATLVLMRDGKPVQMTIAAFAERAGKAGKSKIEERIHDPLVRTDHDLAMVWAQFDFLADGKVEHCGTDVFNLVHVDGKWLIASIADTGRKDCAAK